MAVSQIKARRLIRDFNPDIVVGTGGYVCWPPGVYGVTSLTFFSQFFILLTRILSLILQILTWIFLSSVEKHNMQAAHSPDMQRLLP